MAKALLRRFGYEPDVASNGLEALDAVRRRRYDLVLMDIQMPEMGGRDATRAILTLDGALPRPRVVGLSANAWPKLFWRRRAPAWTVTCPGR